jgi:cytochrome b
MPQRSELRLVWDVLVRFLHAGFIAGVAAAWFTRHRSGPWHEWIGYAVIAALALRLLWGFVGPPSARFDRFVRRPATTLQYTRGVVHGRAPRYVGHNPLGGWMIVVLLALLAIISASGWLSTTDRYWGIAWVMNVHLYATWALLALLPLHIAGAVHASAKHRENLIAAMLHGRKRHASGDDVDL